MEGGREAVRLNPDSPVTYAFLVFGDIGLNRLNETKATYQQAIQRKLDSPFLHQGLYQIAFLQNDIAEMKRQVAWSAGKPGVEDILLNLKSETAAPAVCRRPARCHARL